MAAGSISPGEFTRSANRLCELSQQIGDSWQLKQVEEVCFLCKKCEKSLIIHKREKNIPEELDDDLVTEDDKSTLVCSGASETEDLINCSIEYNIIYSQSYAVPVLYFNVYKPDGSLLSLEELWSTVPASYVEGLEHDKWTFITQQEHPLLGRPYFQLHPCHTATLMGKVLQSQNVRDAPDKLVTHEYLVSWLSSVAGIVHLEFPLEYAKIAGTKT